MALIKGVMTTALLLLGVLHSAWAQSDDPKFTYPEKGGERLKFYDNTQVVVAFECPTDTVVLSIFCRDENVKNKIHPVAVFPDVSCAEGDYSFRVDFDYYASRCWFNMKDSDRDQPSFDGLNSPGFELSRTEADATFGPGQPTASITTSSIPSSTQPPQSSSTADTNPSESANTDDSSSGLSTGAKAGIGVGVAVGVLGIAALIGAFWLLKRRKGRDGPPSSLRGDDVPFGGQPRKLHAESGGYRQSEYQGQEYYSADEVKYEKPHGPSSELAGSPGRHELESEERHELQG